MKQGNDNCLLIAADKIKVLINIEATLFAISTFLLFLCSRRVYGHQPYIYNIYFFASITQITSDLVVQHANRQ